MSVGGGGGGGGGGRGTQPGPYMEITAWLFLAGKLLFLSKFYSW